MALLASKEHPIRCSKLSAIVKCSMRVMMLEHESDEDSEGGPPAQTGSVVHAGVAEFHRMSGQTLLQRKKGAWDAIANTMNKFPLADETEVRLFITPYMDDPRNIDATMLAIEQEVEFSLDPHPLDQTGERIYVQGTLDQIRLERGSAKVWDLKTGRKTGWELIHDHAIQLAAYVIGANEWIKDQVSIHIRTANITPGGIIRAHGYRTKDKSQVSPDGVFFDCGFNVEDIPLILEPVQLHVALMRNGQAFFGTGPHCTYCEYGGLVGCIPHYQKLTRKN